MVPLGTAPTALSAAESDAWLVERVRAGDTSSFSDLYRAHVGAVTTVVRSSVRNPEMAADLVQEVFARGLENLAKLQDPQRFRPWLLSIARHASVDQHRLNGRFTPLADEAAEALPDLAPGPDVMAELSQLAELVRGCVAGLSRRDATAVSLVTHLGFSPADVGLALGVSPGAAKVIVHRARRRLRDALSLELMVRRHGAGCADFQQLYDEDDLVAAGKHVRECPVCVELVSAEVHLYDARRTGPHLID